MRKFFCTISVVAVLAAYGYINNIIQLAHCDFDSPYKAEAFRIVGIFIPPVGIIEGYITIQDGAK